MAIESYRAAETQLASEARASQFPGIQIVLEVVRKVAGLGGLEFRNFEGLCLDTIQKNSRGNLHYLFESLVRDVERIDIKLEAFESAGETEREALNGLVSEAVARAAEAKSKDRVRRIAHVLANALRSGPKPSYETERELIDAAAGCPRSRCFCETWEWLHLVCPSYVLSSSCRHSRLTRIGGLTPAQVSQHQRDLGHPVLMGRPICVRSHGHPSDTILLRVISLGPRLRLHRFCGAGAPGLGGFARPGSGYI